jgi:hypothetical protein
VILIARAWFSIAGECISRIFSARTGEPLCVKDTLCDYDVPGMILLLDLKGAVRLDRSKHTSVRVSFCTIYDLNMLTPVVWMLWR